MSISLSGGDIAFIAAFIVLPTFILASCIWAIVAIRAGVLLPQRAMPAAHVDDAEAMPPEWPYVAGEQTAFDAVGLKPEPQPLDWPAAESVTGTAEHTALLPDPLPEEPETAVATDQVAPAEAWTPAAPAATESDEVDHEQFQETGEFPLVAPHDWSRPDSVDTSRTELSAPTEPTAPAESIATATPSAAEHVLAEPTLTLPDENDEPLDVESWDTAPEPEPVAADTGDEEDDEDDEPVPDEFFEHTTDLPPAAAIKRKPARKAVAQLRPPVALSGRSRLRPAGVRRPGDEPNDNGLTTEDEGAVQGDDGAVHIPRADDE